jgi:hypothetical protein
MMHPLDYDVSRPVTRSWRVSPLLWAGMAVLLVGVGPLLAIIIASQLGLLSDPNPNPIGPGLLAFLTFWPGVGLTLVGAVLTARRRLVAREGKSIFLDGSSPAR